MTVEEFYAAVGGDYEGVLGRLRSEERLRKFAVKFLSDPSYEKLCEALKSENYEDAFRAAHTLKGVCQNLGFTRLYESSSVLTEALRDGEGHYGAGMLEQVERDYREMVEAVRMLQSENENKNIDYNKEEVRWRSDAWRTWPEERAM